MNNVCWWLNHVDEGDLIDTFFSLYPIDYEHTSDHKKSILYARCYEKLRFLAFLHNLRNLEPPGGAEDHVFFAVPRLEGGDAGIVTCLCRTEDLMSSEEPEVLTWLLVDLDELVGYWIADTELTQANILFVLSKILYVASFLGYTGRYRSLYQSLDSDAEPASPGPDGDEPDAVDETEQALLQDARRSEIAYNEYCFQREASILRAMLFAQ